MLPSADVPGSVFVLMDANSAGRVLRFKTAQRNVHVLRQKRRRQAKAGSSLDCCVVVGMLRRLIKFRLMKRSSDTTDRVICR
jgi:hypothetical protein